MFRNHSNVPRQAAVAKVALSIQKVFQKRSAKTPRGCPSLCISDAGHAGCAGVFPNSPPNIIGKFPAWVVQSGGVDAADRRRPTTQALSLQSLAERSGP